MPRDPQASSLSGVVAAQPGIFLVLPCKRLVDAVSCRLKSGTRELPTAALGRALSAGAVDSLAGSPALARGPPRSSPRRPRASSQILLRPQAHRPLPASCHTLPNPAPRTASGKVPALEVVLSCWMWVTKAGHLGGLVLAVTSRGPACLTLPAAACTELTHRFTFIISFNIN